MGTETNIGFDLGEDVTIRVTVRHVDAEGNTVPTDIGGWTLQCDIKPIDGGTAIISKTTSDGITITDEENGKFEIYLTDTDTDKLVAATYKWGAKRMDADQEAGLAKGLITMGDSVAV